MEEAWSEQIQKVFLERLTVVGLKGKVGVEVSQSFFFP